MKQLYLKRLLHVFYVVCIASTSFLAILTVSNSESEVTIGIFPTSLLCSLRLTFFSLFQEPQVIARKSVVTALKSCLDTFPSVFQKHKVPLFLLDKDVLSELSQLQENLVGNCVDLQTISHNFRCNNNKLITFALEANNFEDKYQTIMEDLKSHGYIVHLSMDVDPRISDHDRAQVIPTHFWIASTNHVIHVALLHERLNSSMWIGPINPKGWKIIEKSLAPALTDGVNITGKIDKKLMKHAQAFDKTKFINIFRFNTSRQEIHIPWNVTIFLEEYENSQFIECDYKRARKYKEKYEKSLTPQNKEFKIKAKELIVQAKSVLDKLNVPFTLSGGSCLGWYRQCDIIPYTKDVDFEILIHNYNENIIDEMQKAGLLLKIKYGKLHDSLEYSFRKNGTGIKLDIFFVYKEIDHFWLGGMKSNGQKYKYRLPIYTLCWTEFLSMNIRVPCNPKKYIEMNYGTNWRVPTKKWVWNLSPRNIKTNGMWNQSDIKEARQIFS